MSIDDCDVLIVGAGPVGLLLALILHAKGVNVKIVERQKALYPLPRAVAFDHESGRVMGSLGLTKELERILQNMLFKGGDSGTNYLWRDADLKMVVDLFFEQPTRSGYPSAMAFCQPELESVLNQAAIDRQIPIIRGYTISHLEEKGDKMDVLLEAVIMKQGQTIEERDFSQVFDPSANDNSHLRLGASYVVGCDGANSTVHRLMKFTNTDLNFENDWLVIDLLLQNGYIPPRVARVGCCQVCDPARPTTIVSGGHGRKRFQFMRLPHETKEDILRDDTIWDLLQPWGFNKGNCQLERKVVYTFRARWANEAFKGRVMLAGDALHLMPPFMGQGLNSGLRDAAALGWRLPLMLSGVADPDKLLKSYQVERIEHVKWLTVHSVKLGEVVCETDPIKSKEMHTAMRNDPPPQLYNPPLGRPGILTDQTDAGNLALQRPLKVIAGAPDDQQPMFDNVHGFGWILLNLGDGSVESQLSDRSRKFFGDVLQGKYVSITSEQDMHGEYRQWFANDLQLDHVVLVRPDFYVFGHAAAKDADGLLEDLRTKLGAQ